MCKDHQFSRKWPRQTRDRVLSKNNFPYPLAENFRDGVCYINGTTFLLNFSSCSHCVSLWTFGIQKKSQFFMKTNPKSMLQCLRGSGRSKHIFILSRKMNWWNDKRMERKKKTTQTISSYEHWANFFFFMRMFWDFVEHKVHI